MESCPFCRIARGADPNALVVFEDDDTLALAPLKPATRGHTLVIPKRHTARVWDLRASEATALMKTVVNVADVVQGSLGPAGMNIIQSNGAEATQTIDHVHFHVVPRWKRDRMVLRWPHSSVETLDQQRETAGIIRSSLEHASSSSLPITSPEDRRQHLGFIQAVISRMASASASAKTWLLPIVTAAYGYALIEQEAFIALLGILAVLVFGLLDANYLKQERSFRKLYDRVVRGEKLPPFAMNQTVAGPEKGTASNYWPDMDDWKSWAIAPFYLPMLTIGIVIFLYSAPLCSWR